jgi:penicillin-binding protein-related factor A (putative recombinase)
VGRHAPQHQAKRAAIGNVTEKIIETANLVCERAGLCSLRRVSTPMKVIGSHPKGVIAVFTESTTVDYLGWTKASPPRIVAVEVKHADRAPNGRVYFAFSRFEPQQRIDLAAIHKLGGVAVVLCVCDADLYAVPWGDIDALLSAKPPRASMWVDQYRAKDSAYMRGLV